MNKPRQQRRVAASEDPVTLLIEESTLKDSRAYDQAAFVVPTLTFLTGDSLGKELPLLRQQMTIGRDDDCDLF